MKFTVTYHECYFGEYEVEANSKEEAEELVKEDIFNGRRPAPNECYDSGCQTVEVVPDDLRKRMEILKAKATDIKENEEKIQQSIAALTKGKTLLVIAHRLSTIKNANQIIVLQNGQVENTGTHQQLLDGDALYRDMWEAHIGAQNWSAGSGKGGN